MANCSKCGGENVTLKSGISKKNGKAWKGYKCADCDNMDFLKTPKAEVTKQTASVGNGRSTDAMLMSYCKDVVCSEIAAKIEVREPFKRIADGYKVLLRAFSNPFPAPKLPVDEPPPDEESAPF